MRELGNNELESQSLSQQVQETAWWARSHQHLARENLWSQMGSRADEVISPAGRASSSNATGDQCGVEQHSGVWSSAVTAVVWSLPQLCP